MAVTSSRGRTELLQAPINKWKDRQTSPERNRVWTEPIPKMKTGRKIPIVYYLSRDGHLEHPHFIEVPLSSSEGLYLKDVINRLDCVRGKGMASMYSWSSKRSYKNGFVWNDLSENDFIYPAHGQEYVLKGSELLDCFKSQESSSSSSSEKPPELSKSGGNSDFPVVVRRRNQSWSSIDLNEYKVYKAESPGNSIGIAADAATQTDDKRRRRRTVIKEEEEEEENSKSYGDDDTTELNREEISPPPSSSSPETLETLIKADARITNVSRGVGEDLAMMNNNNQHPSGRIKASSVLMQLISCGSFSFKDNNKDERFTLMSQYRSRLPRGVPDHRAETPMRNPSFGALEDKEYFSGSLIEVKKDEFPALKRSSSYNADGSSKLVLREKEIDGVRAKCIPRKPKTGMNKEGSSKMMEVSKTTIGSSDSTHGSKRFEGEAAVPFGRHGK